jgi:uncharacterized membrane protein YczE
VSQNARLTRLITGLVLCGVAVSLMVRARLGLGPWDVLHQGIANHTGIAIGTVGILVGLAVLVLWIPIRERPGLGTIANMVLIGLVIDVLLAVIEPPQAMAVRVLFLLVGVGVFAPGIALYVGAALGAGPRDGLMTNLARRGMSIRAARTVVELGALLAGFALGGTIGLGTVLYAATIGPSTQWWMRRLPGHVVLVPATSTT